MSIEVGRPLIVLSEPRSGSNWFKAIIDSHPQIRLLNEAFLLHNAGHYEENPLHPMRFSSADDNDGRCRHKGLANNPYGAHIISELLNWLKESGQDARIHGTKEVDIALHLGWLFSQIADKNIVLLGRDLRGNVASFLDGNLLNAWGLQNRLCQLKQTVAQTPTLDTLYGSFLPSNMNDIATHRVVAYLLVILKLEATRNIGAEHILGNLVRIEYEDLVTDPETEIERIFEAIGLNFPPEVLEYIRETTMEVRATGTYNIHRGKVGENGAYDFATRLEPEVLNDIEAIAMEAGIRLKELPKQTYKGGLDTKRSSASRKICEIVPETRETVALDIYNNSILVADKGLEPYRYASTLVTNAQYAQFLYWLRRHEIDLYYSGFNLFYNNRPKDEIKFDKSNPTLFVEKELRDHPIKHITYPAAYFFCRWVGGRLPTRKEWKQASFSKEQLTTNQINVDLSNANIGDNYPWTTPVNMFPPNELGVYDWVGNTAIFVSDQVLLPEGGRNIWEKHTVGGAWSHPVSEAKPNHSHLRLWWQPASTVGIRVVFDSRASLQLISDIDLIQEIINTVKEMNFSDLGETV